MNNTLILLICLLTIIAGLYWMFREEPNIKPIGEIDWGDQTPYYSSNFLDAVLYIANMRGIDVNKRFEVKVLPKDSNGASIIGNKKGIAVGHIQYDPAIKKYISVPYSAPYHYAIYAIASTS